MNNSIQNQPFTGAYSIKVNLANYNTGDRIYLPDTPVLQDKYITAIDIFWSTSNTPVKDPEGDIISGVDFSNLYLTLTDLKNVDFLSKVPLNYFASGNRQIKINRYIFLPDCYLTVGDIKSKNFVFMTFYYTDKIECNTLSENVKKEIQSLEVPVFDSAFNRFFLPDNRILVDKKIRNIYSLGQELDTNPIVSPSGKPLINSDNAFLTLVYRNDIILYRIPVNYLAQWRTTFELRMDNLLADLPSSYIELSQDISQTVGDKCVYLNFEYES